MLSGTTTLVVEDEYLIALEIQRILEAAGAVAIIAPVGIDGSLPAEGHPTFDLAVVSVRPDHDSELTLCAELRARGIAVVVLTASAEHVAGIPGLDAIPVVLKPFTDHELLGAVAAALLAAARPPGSSAEVGC